jgi:RHS repeat-associated protein
MKKYYHTLLGILLILCIGASPAYSQLVGGTENGQTLPREVKPANITEGMVDGNVNLFDGTFNYTYPLGTVSTPQGLSFSLQLSYNSSFIAGTEQPLTSGIPYGEGWDINVPSISISNYPYAKYPHSVLAEMDKQKGLICINTGYTSSDSITECAKHFTSEEAAAEGFLYWFRPVLNIPEASGYLSFKYNDDRGAIFTLANFDRYIEVIYKGNTWEVILDNGVIYEFNVPHYTYRNPSNQRLTEDVATNSNVRNSIMPKQEMLSWYVSRITHKNYKTDNTIYFKYNQFGKFNFHKEMLTQEGFPLKELFETEHIVMPFVDFTVYRDIFLKEISSGSERLELNHRLFAQGLTTNVPNVSDTANVHQLDSLYYYQTVYSTNSTLGFQGWKKFKHLRSPDCFSPITIEFLGCEFMYNNTSLDISPTNPYIGYRKGYAADVDQYQYAVEHIGATDTSVMLNHSFLESPQINQRNIVAGDIYEVKTHIRDDEPSPSSGSKLTTYDVNIVTGNNQPNGSIEWARADTGSLLTPRFNARGIDAKRNQTIFSTFNRPYKWFTKIGGIYPIDQIQTSNFFVMPTMPDQFKAFYVQVGLGNSDTDFAIEKSGFFANTQPISTTVLPDLYHTYAEHTAVIMNPNGTDVPIKACDDVPANFGIGAPWNMMKTVHAKHDSLFYVPGHIGGNFWGNDLALGDGCYPYPNRPTRSENTEVSNVELVRYTKMPYMLNNVRKYQKNGVWDSRYPNRDWHLIDSIFFSYKNVRIPRLNQYTLFSVLDTATIERDWRNIVLLKKIERAPVGQYSSDPDLSVQFDYNRDSFGLIMPVVDTTLDLAYSNRILVKVTNVLGKETHITYYEEPQSRHLYEEVIYPHVINRDDSLISKRPVLAYKIWKTVENITIQQQGEPSQTWNYSFTAPYFRGHADIIVTGINPWSAVGQAAHNISLGFKTTTVLDPPVLATQLNTRHKRVYEHHTDTRWGRLEKLTEYDAQNRLIRSKSNKYTINKAFRSGMLRGDHGNHLTAPDYFDRDTNTLNQYCLPPSDYYEARFPKYRASTESYFIKLESDTSTVFEYNGATAMPHTTVTDYGYFDATEQGYTTPNSGYVALLGANHSNQLNNEPSWQLYSKKTYNLTSPDDYTLEENFYYYDLVNDSTYFGASGNVPNHSSAEFANTTDGLDGLYFSWMYSMRNIPFEKRITKREQGQEVRRSTYYNFDSKWPRRNYFPEQVVIRLDTCQGIPPPPTTSGGGIHTFPNPADWGCHQNRGNVPECYLPLYDYQGQLWYCPCDILDDTLILSPFHGSYDSLATYTSTQRPVPGYELANSLLFRSLHVQTSETLNPEYAQNEVSAGHTNNPILRFVRRTPANGQPYYEPLFPFSNKKMKEVKSRNVYAQVEEELDASGVSTLYLYEPYADTVVRDCGDWYSLTYTRNINRPYAAVVGHLSSDSLVSYFTYHSNGAVKSITDAQGIRAEFTYDGFNRLYQAKSHFSGDVPGVVTTYQYVLGAVDRYIHTTTTFADGTPTQQSRELFDGLGRAKETLKLNYHPISQQHVATAIEYDALGRTTKVYQPYEATSTDFTPPPSTTLSVQTEYENSPLSRPLKVINTDGTTRQTQYALNVANEVKRYKLDGSFDYYPPNSLTKTTLTDENGHQSIEYKDTRGKVVMSVRVGSPANLVTYYIYDIFGNLRVVMPPGSTSISSGLNFKYTYDIRNRMIQKQIPDAGITQMYYDDNDRVVLIQDQNMRAQDPNKYIGTRYDVHGRAVRTGFVYSTTPEATALTTLTIQPADVLTETVYTPFKNRVERTRVRVLDGTANKFIETSMDYDTWGRVRKTIETNQAGKIDSVRTWYNLADRITKVERKFSTPNLAVFGTIGESGLGDSFGGVITLREEYEYDSNGRETGLTHTMGYYQNGVYKELPKTILNELRYDINDRIVERNIGKVSGSTGNFLQSVDYKYNSRGWLTRINQLGLSRYNQPIYTSAPSSISVPEGMVSRGDAVADVFGEELYYDQVGNTGAMAQKNGNIAVASWQMYGRMPQVYKYEYDDFDRLKLATYGDVDDVTNTLSWTNKFREQVVYDERGNPKNVYRNGLKGVSNVNGVMVGTYGAIDALSYSYWNESNRVHTIGEGSNRLYGYTRGTTVTNSYGYDGNGNIISDGAKGIVNIAYNYLNLPDEISFGGGKKLTFVYDAMGRKLSKRVYDGTSVEERSYFGGIEYRNGQLERVATSAGSVTKQQTASVAFRYEYVLSDHLGNTRAVISDLDDNGLLSVGSEVIQVNHYYPYGLNMQGPWNGSAGSYKYQYNGKELTDALNLNWNDYGARYYDAARIQWTGVDPLAEKYMAYGGYHYVMNNPVRLIDPNGMNAVYVDGVQVYGAEEKYWNRVVAGVMGNPNGMVVEGWGGDVSYIPPTLYLVNMLASDSNINPYKVAEYAANIFEKNGFLVNVQVIGKEQVADVFEGKWGDFEFGTNSYDEFGLVLSTETPDNFMGYSDQSPTNLASFRILNPYGVPLSWVNPTLVGLNYPGGDVNYKTAQAAVHETVHQMLERVEAVTGLLITYNTSSYGYQPHHFNGTPNILNSADEWTPSPVNRSSLGKYEQILDSVNHRCLIQSFYYTNFFEHMKK